MAGVMKAHVDVLVENDDTGSALEDTNELRNSEGESDEQMSANEESDEGSNVEDEDGGLGDDDDDDDDDDGGGGGDGGGEDQSNANAGWAQAMAQILGKQPKNKTTILANNSQLKKEKAKVKLEQQERRKQIDKKRAWEMMCRVKPDIVLDREAERALQRTATRGVVQLFNAVRSHQKNIDDKVKKEAGGSERKKAKILSSVSKKDFIDVLRRTDGGSSVKVKEEKSVDEKTAWSVLREDYMMGATMKDWDKESDQEETGGKG
ncbi:RRP15-like protein [Nerophis ophidion]|uniref:RRP15-like protein n=1 Tax=Nerophis ophidion TaxID=159077 RepID=UPI002AE038E1|nr:RRP15-like protein [Nerophis ophidion]